MYHLPAPAARLLSKGIFVALLFTAPAAVLAASPEDANEIIQDWPDISKKVAQTMMDQYGDPDEATESLLIWRENDPWLRTMVYKEPVDHEFPMPHKDVLEQFISYEVEPHFFDELAEYDGSVIVERTKGEISARCDKEAANFLALNLAHEITEGNMSVYEARETYAESVKAAQKGNPPERMQGFTFDVPRDYAGDPDKAIIMAQK